jgi:ATP-dependent helicase/nuclease subunit B
LYVLGMLAATHPNLHLIAGRRSAENEPLVPSRLLFACGMEELPRRARRLFAPPAEAPRIALPGGIRPGQGQKSALPVPVAEPLAAPVESLRVTEFRDYLACPFRYYLKHRLQLFALADSAEELDGGQFGALLHDALQQFATSEAVDSIDPAAIHDQLYISLGELAARRFGEAPQPAVRVQIEMLKLRLEQFAERQADWRKQGWRIRAVERDFVGQDAPFIVDGEPIYLHGRIDRIDHNEHTGAWAVLDYKSSDGGASPDKVHRDKDGWIDLQLPLYRHLARGLGDELSIDGQLQLGYVLLPKDPTKAKFELAAWTPAQLEEADRVAAEIVRNIRNGVFGPPTVPAPVFFEDFAAICQDDQFGAAGQPTDDGEEDSA